MMADKRLAKRMGRVVKRLRNAKGLSQEQFASNCGLHRTYVGAIERGEKIITIETANKLAIAFGISLAQLFQELEKRDVHHDKNRN